MKVEHWQDFPPGTYPPPYRILAREYSLSSSEAVVLPSACVDDWVRACGAEPEGALMKENGFRVPKMLGVRVAVEAGWGRVE